MVKSLYSVIEFLFKMTGIYKITSPSNKVYIGQSVDIFYRLYNYDTLDCKGQRKLYNSLKKYGFNNHKFEIIELCGESDLNYWERYYQDLFNVIGENGLNCKLTGTNDKSGRLSKETKLKIKISNTSLKRSEETKLKFKNKIVSDITKEKIRQIRLGSKLSEETKQKLRGSKGFKHSKESIEKMRLSKLGIPRSEEVKLKLSLANKGKKYSDEYKRNMSKIKMGHVTSDETKLKISQALSYKVIDINTQQIYNSPTEISILFNIPKSTLISKLNGRYNNNTQFVYLKNYGQ